MQNYKLARKCAVNDRVKIFITDTFGVETLKAKQKKINSNFIDFYLI